MHDWQSFESAYPLLGRSLRMAKHAGRLGHSHLVVSSNAAIRNRFPTLLAQLAVCLAYTRSAGNDGDWHR